MKRKFNRLDLLASLGAATLIYLLLKDIFSVKILLAAIVAFLVLSVSLLQLTRLRKKRYAENLKKRMPEFKADIRKSRGKVEKQAKIQFDQLIEHLSVFPERVKSTKFLQQNPLSFFDPVLEKWIGVLDMEKELADYRLKLKQLEKLIDDLDYKKEYDRLYHRTAYIQAAKGILQEIEKGLIKLDEANEYLVTSLYR